VITRRDLLLVVLAMIVALSIYAADDFVWWSVNQYVGAGTFALINAIILIVYFSIQIYRYSTKKISGPLAGYVFSFLLIVFALHDIQKNDLRYHYAKISLLKSTYEECVAKSKKLENGKRYAVCSSRPNGNGSGVSEVYDEGGELGLPMENRSSEWKRLTGLTSSNTESPCTMYADRIIDHFYRAGFNC
jgi:hypothetical protein